MATQTRTRKSSKKRVVKRPAKRRTISKKLDRIIERFMFWSTLGFWGLLSFIALTHGWVPAVVQAFHP